MLGILYMIAQTMGADSMKPAHYKNVIAVLPMFHITGLAWIVHIPIICNAEVYMLPGKALNPHPFFYSGLFTVGFVTD